MYEERNRHAVLISKHLKPGRRGFLRRDDSRNLLRRTLECYAQKHGLVIYAWSATAEKLELIVEIPSPVPLGETLLSLFHYFTRRHNARYSSSSGPIFRNRWLSRVLDGGAEIGRAIERLHENSAELEEGARAGSEPYSSARAYAGFADGVTTLFPRDRIQTQRRVA